MQWMVSVRNPHAYPGPADTAVNDPGIPNWLRPQHSIVPPARNPHPCSELPETWVNDPDGPSGGTFSQQRVLTPVLGKQALPP